MEIIFVIDKYFITFAVPKIQMTVKLSQVLSKGIAAYGRKLLISFVTCTQS